MASRDDKEEEEEKRSEREWRLKPPERSQITCNSKVFYMLVGTSSSLVDRDGEVD